MCQKQEGVKRKGGTFHLELLSRNETGGDFPETTSKANAPAQPHRHEEVRRGVVRQVQAAGRALNVIECIMLGVVADQRKSSGNKTQVIAA